MDNTHRSFTRESVIEEQKKGTWCQELLKTPGDEKVSEFIVADANQYMLIEGIIYHRDEQKNSLDGQLQLVMSEVFRRLLVEEIHGGVHGGHFGVERTLDALRRHYWWNGMRKDVEETVRGCPECDTRGSGSGGEGHCSNLQNELELISQT